MLEYTNLPGIRTIGIVSADDLPRYVVMESICGSWPAVAVPAKPIAFTGHPEVKAVLSVNDRETFQRTDLVFETADPIGILGYSRLGFVVTDVNGRSWLIGSREGPYPWVELETGTAGPDRKVVYKYSVTLSAVRSLIRCVLP
ncbi:MAG: hypothetical protein HDS67_02330 [Bacteroidales bacterium]|nr:hypothetical protein [Bacteroidales bacterium]